MAEGLDAASGEKAITRLPVYQATKSSVCLEFSYFVRGTNIGSFDILRYDFGGNFVENLFKVNSNQGN